MFTWDPQKAILNFGKHGVSFEEASTIFDDARGLEWDDTAHSTDEPRLKRIGTSRAFRVLIVVYTIRRAGNGRKQVRIISARPASRKEREAYAG
jgi:uncharacterized DUF497 family protein